MVLPDKVPVYVTTPTAPKLIVLPVRLPLMCTLSGGDDSMIVPSSALAVCVHVSENEPLNGPVYYPVHVPLRSTEGGAWVAVGVGNGNGVGIAVGRIGAWIGGRCKMAIRAPTVAVTATSTASAAAGLHLCPGGSSPMTSTMMRSLATEHGARCCRQWVSSAKRLVSTIRLLARTRLAGSVRQVAQPAFED
jgi:hypothetical protein